MHMRMVVEVLPPGVEHRDGAELGAQMLGFGSAQAQGLGGRLEQQPVDQVLVAEGDLLRSFSCGMGHPVGCLQRR